MATANRIALFPLANVVLFPTLSVPLYIFEQRYREMTRQALEGKGRIGMVAVRPGHADEMMGDPPVFDVGCEGMIEESQERPDGTYVLLLRATHRFRIVEELTRRPEQLYRVAHVEYEDDLPCEEGLEHVASARMEVSHGLRHLLERLSPETAGQLSLDRLGGIDDTQFVDALSQALDFDVLEKQRLLESRKVTDRYELMRELMRFRLAELDALDGPGSGVLQ